MGILSPERRYSYWNGVQFTISAGIHSKLSGLVRKYALELGHHWSSLIEAKVYYMFDVIIFFWLSDVSLNHATATFLSIRLTQIKAHVVKKHIKSNAIMK